MASRCYALWLGVEPAVRDLEVERGQVLALEEVDEVTRREQEVFVEQLRRSPAAQP